MSATHIGMERKSSFVRAVRPGRVTIRKKPASRRAVVPRATKVAIERAITKKLEVKYSQSSTGIQNVFSSGTTAGSFWTDITSFISQGAGDFNNRIGDQISLNLLSLNYTIFTPAAATATPSNVVRVMVIQYCRDDNTPLSTQLFRTNSLLVANQYNAYGMRNRDYLKFYKVIYDQRHVVITNTAAATAVPPNYRVDVKTHIPLKKIVHYIAGGTVSENGIWLFAIGDQGTTVQNPNFAANWQLTYTDA